MHLALTLKEGGNVLLLDEPSNDLDVETLRSLEEALLDFPGSAIVISHDRWFLDRVATHILAYEDDSQAVFFEGNYTEYEADKQAPRRRRRAPAPAAFQGVEIAHPRCGLAAASPSGGEPAPSERLRAREWLANAIRLARRMATPAAQ